MKTRLQHTSAISIALASLLILGGRYDRGVVNAQESQTEVPPNDTASSDTATDQDFSDDESPSLGVLVGPCPGGGVCVIETMPGGPAQSNGIQADDYILAINDQDVSSPKELKQMIEKLKASDTINVSIWRRGQKLTKQVALASEARELPGSHRSWLGVRLSGDSDQQAGIVIEDIQGNSPADRAGIRSGDGVTKINGEEVKSMDQFVEMVQDYEPGAELKLVIRRGERDIELPVVLGEVDEAPMQWFRKSFRMPMDDGGFSMPLSPGMGMMDEAIDDLRQQIRSLQKQIDELKSPVPPPISSSLDGVDENPAGQPDEDGVSSSDGFSSRFTTLVQYDGRRGFRPNFSNDWTGSRYGNRGYRDRGDRYSGRYQSNYGNRGYQSYPYRYFGYGGRPSYYGGRSSFGYRGGVRIGPNFNVWW